jgi:hypothetical protein
MAVERCSGCLGRKKVIGFGNMGYRNCKKCDGIGYTKVADEEVKALESSLKQGFDNVSITTALVKPFTAVGVDFSVEGEDETVAEEVKVTPRRGRPKAVKK